MSEFIQIKNMHFYWRIKENAETHNPFSSFIETTLFHDKHDGILKLEADQNYWKMMNEMYALEENVGYLQPGHDLAIPYGDEYLKFINRHLKTNRRICDVGAGGLYVISKLKTQGYSVMAVDPSQESKINGISMNLEVISQFYEDVDLRNEGIDAFIHYDVLEHVKEPSRFLEKHYRELEDDGTIVFAVPDCTIPIRNGDISMLLAQHVNYFDSKTLSKNVKEAGFDVIEICSSKYGGVLFCAAKKKKKNKQDNPPKLIEYRNFFELAQDKMKYVTKYFEKATEENQKIGLYIPLRIFPYISNFIDYHNLVFIDDSSYFKGKYFDGFTMQIQDITNVVSHLDSVVIFSPAFGEKIKHKLLNHPGFKGNVISWEYQ